MLTDWSQFGAVRKVEVARPSQSLKKIPTDSFRPEDNRPQFRFPCAEACP
jgi:hypothetical protein